jgi:hypothetical protein
MEAKHLLFLFALPLAAQVSVKTRGLDEYGLHLTLTSQTSVIVSNDSKEDVAAFAVTWQHPDGAYTTSRMNTDDIVGRPILRAGASMAVANESGWASVPSTVTITAAWPDGTIAGPSQLLRQDIERRWSAERGTIEQIHQRRDPAVLNKKPATPDEDAWLDFMRLMRERQGWDAVLNYVDRRMPVLLSRPQHLRERSGISPFDMAPAVLTYFIDPRSLKCTYQGEDAPCPVKESEPSNVTQWLKGTVAATCLNWKPGGHQALNAQRAVVSTCESPFIQLSVDAEKDWLCCSDGEGVRATAKLTLLPMNGGGLGQTLLFGYAFDNCDGEKYDSPTNSIVCPITPP